MSENNHNPDPKAYKRETVFKYQDFLKGRKEDWIYVEEREKDRDFISKSQNESLYSIDNNIDSRITLLLAQVKERCNKILLTENMTPEQQFDKFASFVRRCSHPVLFISKQSTADIDNLQEQEAVEYTADVEDIDDVQEADEEIEIVVKTIEWNQIIQIENDLIKKISKSKGAIKLDKELTVTELELLSQVLVKQNYAIVVENGIRNIKSISDINPDCKPVSLVISK
jgi:hypothetical protein